MVTTLSTSQRSHRDEVPLPQRLQQMDLDRLRAYRENLEFYRGQQWADAHRRRERRLTFNYAKAIIEKTAAYVLTGYSIAVEPADSSPEAAERARRAEQALRQVHEANALDQLDFDNEIDCSILGDAAYKVTWNPGEGRVRVSAPDVQGLYVWWLGDDPSRVWRVACRYTLTHEEAELLFGDLAGGGPSPALGPAARRADHTVIEVWTDSHFQLWLDGAPLEERANPYGFIPYVIYPNLREPKRFWGVSDLEAIKEPARELNRAMSQLSTILELSGNPITVLENVTEAQDIAVQPGAVWELPEKAKAYLLDLLQGGGVGLHVEYANLLLRTLHDLAEVPRTAFGEGRALSGVALQMELDPLIKKVQRKRLIRAAAFRRRSEMILRILEQQREERFFPCRIRVIWGSVLPQDRSRLVEDEARLVAAGIHSRRTAASLLGVEEAEAEWERWRAEAAALGGEGGP